MERRGGQRQEAGGIVLHKSHSVISKSESVCQAAGRALGHWGDFKPWARQPPVNSLRNRKDPVVQSREVVDGAGFTFQLGSSADQAQRLRFLIANPSVREAAGKAARRRIKDLYQGQKVAGDIQSAYFKVLGWHPVEAPGKKPNTRAVSVGESPNAHRRAG
jgi:hypothetical protein